MQHLSSLKSIFIAFTLIVFSLSAISQSNQWTWIKGDNTADDFGVYGIQGTADAANKPGSRAASVSWKDTSGNMWLFGGLGYDASGFGGDLNDLWKYNPVTNEWTWVKGDSIVDVDGIYGTLGTADAANSPGSRDGSVSWTDADGNLWLFGGTGLDVNGDYGYLNDLWKYNPATDEWTWVNGDSIIDQLGVYGSLGTPDAANKPGARFGAASWTDSSGNMWLFGGGNYNSSVGVGGWLNDLWKYDAATNEWTWVKGDSAVDEEGVYGTQGIADAANKPGGRESPVSWTDSSDNLWLFGGGGLDVNGDGGFLNDLWKYNPVANEWTWVKGDSIIDEAGVYGTQRIPAMANTPGARYLSVSWTDTRGNLWLFGGNGLDAYGDDDFLNDLWHYNPATNQWTWMKGDSTIDNFGVYGTQGTSAPANKPGSRFGSVSWTDTSGNMWLFGGVGGSACCVGFLNDLWKYEPAQPLAITCPPDVTDSILVNSCSKTVLLDTPLYSGDNLTWQLRGATTGISGTGVVPLTQQFNSGVTTVIYTVREGRLQLTCRTSVTVVDAVAPTIAAPPADTTVYPGAGSCTASVAIPDIKVSDNCSVRAISWQLQGATNAAGRGQIGTVTLNTGITTVKYQVRDNAGNTGIHNYNITVADTTAPVVNAPADIVQNSCARSSINTPPPTMSDCSGIPKLTWIMTGATTGASPSTGRNFVGRKTFMPGVTTITYAATDAAGNVGTDSFTVTLNCPRPLARPLPVAATAFKKEVKEMKVNLSPNPTSHAFSLMVQSPSAEALQVNVYNSKGQKVGSLKAEPQQMIHFGDSYQAGSYMIEVRQGEKRMTVRGVKSN